MSDNMRVHHSKKDNKWNTPRYLFDILNKVMPISLDCASSPEHTLVPGKYITEKEDETWTAEGETGLFINPPYSPTKVCTRLVKKVVEQAKLHNIPAAILIPSRTDTKLWQDIIFPNCSIIFISGRIKFEPSGEVDFKKVVNAPFPSALCFVNLNKEELVEIANRLNTKPFAIKEANE